MGNPLRSGLVGFVASVLCLPTPVLSDCPDIGRLYEDSHRAVFIIRDARDDDVLGSGFLVNSEGLAFTNAHVIDAGRDLRAVFHDHSESDVQIFGKDPGTDLALIRVAPVKGHELELAEYSPPVGTRVVGLGGPYGFPGTLAVGHVTGVDRFFKNEPAIPYLQVELGINPGSSGGPVLDKAGRVVGVMTQVIVGEAGTPGLGFAVPGWLAARVLSRLDENDHDQAGWLGLKLDANAGRLEVTGVAREGPAWEAGIRPGDRLTPADVTGSVSEHFRADLLRPLAGQEVHVIREGEGEPGVLILQAQAESESRRELATFGLTVRAAASASQAELEVLAVQGQSELRPGDRILRIGSTRVGTPEALERALEERADGPVPVKLRRDGDTFFLPMVPTTGDTRE